MKNIIFLFFSLILTSISLMAQQKSTSIDIQGHRGARGLAPENTIPAFLTALDHGVSTLELDLCISKDRQVVVSHEPWFSSDICLQPDGTAIVKAEEMKFNLFQYTYEQIKGFDCGSLVNPRFPGQKTQEVSKPLLSQVILEAEAYAEQLGKKPPYYNVEIKSDPRGDNLFHPEIPEFSQLVFDLISKYLPWERVIIQSFDVRVLEYFHKHYPSVKLAYLVEGEQNIETALSRLSFQAPIYSPYFKLLDQSKVKFLQGKGMKVIPWTVNEVDDLKEVASWGVDGIITDYPDRAAFLIKN